MSKITPESTAELKSLFNDNNKATSANFSQLIDFFNDNKVTDNGDGTFSVNGVVINAGDLETSESINTLLNSKDFATNDSVKEEISSAISNNGGDGGGISATEIASGTDVFSLFVNDEKPHYYYCSSNNTAKSLKNSPVETAFSLQALPANSKQALSNSGNPEWTYTQFILQPFNSSDLWVASTNTDGTGNISNTDWTQVASGADVSSAISTATANMVHNVKGDTSWETIDGFKRFVYKPTDSYGYQFMTSEDVNSTINSVTANMVDSSKSTNFTAGLQSGGINVATAADLKSIEDSAWRELDISETNNLSSGESLILCKIDISTNACLISGYVNISQSTKVANITASIPTDYVFNTLSSLPANLNAGLSITVDNGSLTINYNPIRGGNRTIYWSISGSDSTALTGTVTAI